MSEVKLISGSLLEAVTARASDSPRRRMNHNFHSDADDNPHRFLNVLLQGTYIRPHRHLLPPKSETFLVLEGEADVVLFDDQGTVIGRHELGRESAEGHLWGIDIPPGIWHTIVARTERVICFEVKPGPWKAAEDKEFAIWAPPENSPDAEVYIEGLLAR
jgi:cupin fold WbuC family metalloprotein